MTASNCECGCSSLTVDQYMDALEQELGEFDEDGRQVAGPQPKAPEPSAHYKIVCAWCRAVLEEGPVGAAVSHGICRTCEANIE
jgi:hypothetical protein